MRVSSGILWLDIEARGKATHASWPCRGHNAVVGAAAVVGELEALRTRLETERGDIPGIPHTRMSIGSIEGGTKVNVVPERRVIQVEFRVMAGVEPAAVRGEVEAVLRRLVAPRPGCGANLRVIQEQPPTVTPADSRLVRVVADAVEAVTGTRPGAGSWRSPTPGSTASGACRRGPQSGPATTSASFSSPPAPSSTARSGTPAHLQDIVWAQSRCCCPPSRRHSA